MVKKKISVDDLKIGQYVQFSMGYENDSDVLFRIVDIHPETNHILVLDVETNMYNWERIEYIEKVFEVKSIFDISEQN
jgi:hypothetical protein